MMDVPVPRTRVFISYAWKDCAALALQLYHELAKICDPWKDDRRMSAGATWTLDVQNAIDDIPVMVALVSPGSIASEVCGWERFRALRKKKHVIPVLAVAGTDLPLEFEGKLYIDLTGAKPFGAQMQLLSADIAQRSNGLILPKSFEETALATVPVLARNYVVRTSLLETLRASLIADDAGPSTAMLALQGMGGTGKTVLAIGLAHDDVIGQTFPNGVIWVSVGKEPSYDLQTRLREVGRALGDDVSRYDSELASINAYRTAMRERAALVIVDDVWNTADIEPFRAESPRSRILFTTRDASLAASTGANLISLGFLDAGSSRAIFATWSGLSAERPPAPQALPPIADALIEECGGLALGLATIGATVRDQPPEVWQATLDSLKTAKLSEIDQSLSGYTYKSLAAALQVSVDALDAQTRERYLALATYPGATPFPPNVLQAFWRADRFDAIRTTKKLVGLALAVRTGTDGSIVLHDLLMDYVRASYADSGALRSILEAWRLSSGVVAGDPVQFASQLLGRLLSSRGIPAIGSFVHAIDAWRGQLWLQPRSATLTPPGTSLVAFLKENTGGVASVSVSDDGMTIAFAIRTERETVPPAVRVWRVSQGTRTLPISDAASAIALAPDGSVLAVAAGETINLWALGAGAERTFASLPSISGGTVALVFVDSERLAVITGLQELQTWTIGSGQSVCESSVSLPVTPPDSFNSVLFRSIAPAANRFLEGTGSMSAFTLNVWNLAGGTKTEYAKVGNGPLGFNSLAVTPDARMVVLGFTEIAILTGAPESLRISRQLPGNGYIASALAVSRSGHHVVSANYYELRLWDLRLPDPPAFRGTNVIDAFAVRTDGARALVKRKDGNWSIFDIRTLEVTPVPALPADARLLETIYDEGGVALVEESDLVFWNVTNARATRRIASPAGAVVALSRDRRLAACVEDARYIVWNVETRAILSRIGLPPPADGAAAARSKATFSGDLRRATFFPDGECFAAAVKDAIHIWNSASGALLRTLSGFSGYLNTVAVAATPQGIRIVGAGDKTVRIWDPQEPTPLLSLIGNTYSVYDASFSPDGDRCFSAGGDRSLRLWNVTTGACEAAFTADASLLQCVATPDGRTILASDMAGAMHVLDVVGGAQPFGASLT